MLKHSISLLVAMLFAVTLAGCYYNPYFQDNVWEEGAEPLIDKKLFQEIDLALLLDPEVSIDTADCCDTATSRKRLQDAFNAFYANANDHIIRRNRVQDRIIASSNQRCSVYKRFLKRIDMANNSILGSVTTVAAGLGSIFTHAATVRALAGSAAIASGLRGNFNEGFLQQKTIQLVTKGIESRRQVIYDSILKKRQQSANDIKQYNVEKAVADAIMYHDACSLVTGLEEALLNQERAENPGLNELKRTLDRLRNMGLYPTGTADAEQNAGQTTSAPKADPATLIYAADDKLRSGEPPSSSRADRAALTYAAHTKSIPLPLIVFLKVEKAKDKLKETLEKLETTSALTNLSQFVNEENRLEELMQSCTLTPDEIKFFKKWSKQDSNIPVIVNEINVLITEAEDKSPGQAKKKLLCNDREQVFCKEKENVIGLQNEILKRFSEMVAAETENKRKAAIADLGQALVKAELKNEKLFVLQSKLNEKLADASRFLHITKILDERSKKVNGELASCNNST